LVVEETWNEKGSGTRSRRGSGTRGGLVLSQVDSGKLERDNVGDINDGESSPFVSATLFDAALVVGVMMIACLSTSKKKWKLPTGSDTQESNEVKGQHFGIRKAKAKNRMIYGKVSVVLSTVLCGSYRSN
jgi:hypothetical protein